MEKLRDVSILLNRVSVFVGECVPEEYYLLVCAQCSPLEVDRGSKGTYNFHLQGCNVSQISGKHIASPRLYGFTSQKIVRFHRDMPMRTSNLVCVLVVCAVRCSRMCPVS